MLSFARGTWAQTLGDALSWRTIRGRMTVILAVPTCLLLVVVGLAVADRLQDYRDARDTRSQIDVTLRIQDLVHHLQSERVFTNGLLAGDRSYRTQLDRSRDRVDAVRRELSEERVVAGAMTRLERLTAIRDSVDSGSADRTKTHTYYTGVIGALNAADPTADRATRGDRRLRDDLAALQALAEAKEAGSQEGSLLGGALAAGSFRETNSLDFVKARATRISAMDRFFKLATPTQRDAVMKMFSSPVTRRLDTIENAALKASDGSRIRVDGTGFAEDMLRVDATVHQAQHRVDADVQARTKGLSDEATASLAGYLALGALVLTTLVAAAVLAGRSITRPLDALASEADDVARRRLPDTMARIQAGELAPAAAERQPHRSAQEITRVVTALHNVENTAVGLAAEQAVLRRNSAESLASLGRRNQGLVRRQLALITALEQQELDPEALAELFELDHLATRMRRNAESLLVLVDERTPQIRTSTATSLELVQSAIGEVEQYRRVSIAEIEPRRISGRAVAELSHLLAELLENALTFSPPDQPVEVHGWEEGDEFNIAVVDHGVGMSPEDLARANARIAGEEAFLVAPTRYLGHYVVGRLARRLGVEVLLSDTPGGGVSALIILPARLLAPDDDAVPPDRREYVSSMLNGFRAGIARAESR
ncbi:ATP-binding protein [Streptomyces viridochromogenes]|uniref:histidine kinase n=1 Tax=Streptomyces viridochromogenes Tue57 TaxID=1160705 RepID=L8P0A2_STRVR|nr:ATP-binding protein [Streptomyces viridochromogenes]ELS51001.1 putative Sensor protein [Streptomyces viridochromogenes Tue57]